MNSVKVATAKMLAKTVNGVAVDDLFNTIDAIKATPAIAKFKFRIRNQWVDAGQNCSTADTFYGAGQEQSGPKPFFLEPDHPPALPANTIAATPPHPPLH